jgi:hypothetical protein
MGGEVGTPGQLPSTTTAGGEVATTATIPNTVSTGGEVLTDTTLRPQIVGGVGSEPIVGPGGPGIQVDGVDGGSVRGTMNLESAPQPGQAIEASLAVVSDVSFCLDGLVELGRVTVDAVNDAAATTYAVLDMNAAGLVLAGAVALRVNLTAISGLSVQPTLSLGVGGAFDNQVGTTALTLTAVDTHERIALLQPRPLLRSGDVLTLQLDGQATATTYVVEVVVYGFHRVP